MHTATSRDGTTIAYDREGDSDPLVLVPGAFSYRRYPGQVKLAGLLAARFTVYCYDRRGRGDSGGTKPYAVEREIEDLAAVIDAAGGAVNAPVIADTLTEFLTGPNNTARTGGHHA
jgi:pimeloyl-ACP methyl ester carboxylesterase